MLITPLNDLHNLQVSLQDNELPLVIHGSMQGDITLVCYGSISTAVVEAALFLDRLHKYISINVVQIQQFDPIPLQLLQEVLLSMKYILIIESDIDFDLHKILEKETGFNIYHRHYFNPNQENLTAKITELTSGLFITS